MSSPLTFPRFCGFGLGCRRLHWRCRFGCGCGSASRLTNSSKEHQRQAQGSRYPHLSLLTGQPAATFLQNAGRREEPALRATCGVSQGGRSQEETK